MEFREHWYIYVVFLRTRTTVVHKARMLVEMVRSCQTEKSHYWSAVHDILCQRWQLGMTLCVVSIINVCEQKSRETRWAIMSDTIRVFLPSIEKCMNNIWNSYVTCCNMITLCLARWLLKFNLTLEKLKWKYFRTVGVYIKETNFDPQGKYRESLLPDRVFFSNVSSELMNRRVSELMNVLRRKK
jgi:hypothetical protein